jgi:hypothetical protein
MTEALLSGGIHAPPGIGPGVLDGFSPVPFVPPPVSPVPGVPTDTAIGDIKMAARTDDHLELAANWLLCDGRAINRLTYAALFAIVGMNYGIGDGATTFNIPTFAWNGGLGAPNGRSPIGAGPAVGDIPIGAAGGAFRHVHGFLGWLVGLFHTWWPFGGRTGPGLMGLYQAGGVDFGAAPFGHFHNMPGVLHDLTTPPTTDIEPWLAPYLAVGFFIRVD